MAAAAAAGCRTSCRRQTTQTSGGWTSPDHRAEVCMRALHHSQSGLKAGNATSIFRGSSASMLMQHRPCLPAGMCLQHMGKATACASQAEACHPVVLSEVGEV